MKSVLFRTFFRSSLWEKETPLAFVFCHCWHQICTCSFQLPLMTGPQKPMNMLEMRRTEFPRSQLREWGTIQVKILLSPLKMGSLAIILVKLSPRLPFCLCLCFLCFCWSPSLAAPTSFCMKNLRSCLVWMLIPYLVICPRLAQTILCSPKHWLLVFFLVLLPRPREFLTFPHPPQTPATPLPWSHTLCVYRSTIHGRRK